MVQNKDELNIIETKSNFRRSIPYETYFGEMEISEEEKQKRIALANKIEIVFMYLFALIASNKYESNEGLYLLVADMYSNIVNDYMNTDGAIAYLNNYVSVVTAEIIDTTLEYINEEYYTSQDRAMFIAENEANSICNYGEMYDAIKKGCKYKTWKTLKDKRVRHTHKQLDEKKIGIYEPFEVGNSLMLYPKDTSYDADDTEIVNCRCCAVYTKQ